ncbi:MAG: hypothetical protein HC860_26770 [Alkalinema sp. RU_4_3]|nr:hypothetical protein [Alkalinema sp. RU_4_3]
MPMDKSLYPKDWDAIAHSIKTEVAWTCEECGRPCRLPGESVEGLLNRLHGTAWEDDLTEEIDDAEFGSVSIPKPGDSCSPLHTWTIIQSIAIAPTSAPGVPPATVATTSAPWPQSAASKLSARVSSPFYENPDRHSEKVGDRVCNGCASIRAIMPDATKNPIALSCDRVWLECNYTDL